MSSISDLDFEKVSSTNLGYENEEIVVSSEPEIKRRGRKRKHCSEGEKAELVKKVSRRSEYYQGEVVFAQIRGHPPWPARIAEVTEDEENETHSYKVFFYGTYQMGWCKVDQLTMFSTDVDKYRQKYQRKGFQDAILEAELNPACQPAIPEEEVSPNIEQDKNALTVTKKDKIRRGFRGNVLPRKRFNDREFFFGSFYDVGSTMSASEKEESKKRLEANQEQVVSEEGVAPTEEEFANILSRLADTITALKQSRTVPREHLDLIFCRQMLQDD